MPAVVVAESSRMSKGTASDVPRSYLRGRLEVVGISMFEKETSSGLV